MILNRESVKNYLPHRDPLLFVDSVASFEKRGSICATFELKPELPFFKGHFPNMPILPGVIAVEALAQASGLLLALKADSEPGNKMFFLASNNIKFVSVARAGETLELKSVAPCSIKNIQSLHSVFKFAYCERLVSGKIRPPCYFQDIRRRIFQV